MSSFQESDNHHGARTVEEYFASILSTEPFSPQVKKPTVYLDSNKSPEKPPEELHKLTQQRWEEQARQLTEKDFRSVMDTFGELDQYDLAYLEVLLTDHLGIEEGPLLNDFLTLAEPLEKRTSTQLEMAFHSRDSKFQVPLGWVVKTLFPRNINSKDTEVRAGRHIKPELYGPLKWLMSQLKEDKQFPQAA